MSASLRKLMRPVVFVVTLVIAMSGFVPWRAVASSLQQVAEPEIGARAAIVVEYPTGRILYSHAMHDRLAPASTTKIMTSILALEHGSLEELVTISPEDLVGESSMGLTAGEQQTVHNLLYGMLLPSGNDAAMAVARHLGSLAPGNSDPSKSPITRFAEMMNARAEQLGLQDSHFVNPHGLDTDGHYSSVYDLASLTWYAFQFPVFNEIVKQPFYEAPGHPLRNTNEMLTRYGGTDGVKTGWTDNGGLCLVTSATHDGHRLISVVLDAPQWYKDSAALLDYGFAKLAAAPTDESAEVLSVAKRGTAAWLLANATSTPPIPTPGVAALARGGGTAAKAPEPAHVDQAAPVSIKGDTPAQGGGNNFSLVAASTSQKSTFPAQLLVGVLMVALALGVAWWLFGRRQGGIKLRGATASSPASIEAASTEVPASAMRAYVPRPAESRAAARTLGSAPRPRRREPNLLLTKEEITLDHIERAVALATQGKQGSSMSEFLLALRAGELLSVEAIDRTYELDSAGFMALSRAQASMGHLADARATLEYGMAAMPGDRMLRLAHRQLAVH